MNSYIIFALVGVLLIQNGAYISAVVSKFYSIGHKIQYYLIEPYTVAVYVFAFYVVYGYLEILIFALI